MSPRRPAALLALLPLVVAVPACDRGAPPPAPATQAAAHDKPRPAEVRLSPDAVAQNHVEVGVVAARDLTPSVRAPARVTFDAEAMAHVGAPVAGRVAEIRVRLGDTVGKGDELLTVESPDLGEAQSDYLQKRTAADAAAAAVEPARIAYERGKSLFEQTQGLSLAEVQKREAELRAAQATARAAAAAVTGSQNKLALMGMGPDAVAKLERTGQLTPRYAVRAPLAGQVIQRDVTAGALAGPDKDLQLDIADTSRVWVLADVAEADYARVAKGAAATVTAAALPGRTFDGTVALLAPALDPATRTLQVRIEITAAAAGAGPALRPGLLARASIRAAGGPAGPVPAIPDAAVVSLDDQAVVFVPVPGDSGKFRRQAVQVGEPVDGWVAVRAGLAAGDQVVVGGAAIVRAQFAKPPEEE